MATPHITSPLPAPADVLAYLGARGWKQGLRRPAEAVWTKRSRAGEFEVVAPLDRARHSYGIRIAELLETLATAEKRPAHAVLFDMVFVDRDVVRVRAAGDAAADNSLPFDAGRALLDTAANMMLSAACAATGPKALFSGGRPALVSSYLHSLRLGQTEPGSYVLTVLSPVRKQADEDGQPELPFPDHGPTTIDPFRRKVTRTLASALSATKSAAQKATGASIDAFEEAVSEGVSANLLEAIGSVAHIDRIGEFDVGIAWAPIEPGPKTPARTAFSRRQLEKISAAGDVIRRRYAPQESFVLQGYVRKLERPEAAFIGRATIEGAVGVGRTRRVVADIMGDDLQVAISAFAEKDKSVLIEVRGRLDRTTGTYVLRDAHGARRVAEDELDLGIEDGSGEAPALITDA